MATRVIHADYGTVNVIGRSKFSQRNSIEATFLHNHPPPSKLSNLRIQDHHSRALSFRCIIDQFHIDNVMLCYCHQLRSTSRVNDLIVVVTKTNPDDEPSTSVDIVYARS